MCPEVRGRAECGRGKSPDSFFLELRALPSRDALALPCPLAAGPHGQQVGFQSGSRYGRTDPDAVPLGPDDRLQRRFYANGRYGKRSGQAGPGQPALTEFQLLDGTSLTVSLET